MTLSNEIDWPAALQPLLEKYGSRKHPLRALNTYQLVVMVILSARDTDTKINGLAPALFQKYPTLHSLASASPEDLYPFIRPITSFVKKGRWLVDIAKSIGEDERLPQTMEGLTALPGIGRKSANVIMGESGGRMEGVVVDLHVLRVVPRIGIVRTPDPVKIEGVLMEKFPRETWRALGISLTFLGREICRPTDPECSRCPVNACCRYYSSQTKRNPANTGDSALLSGSKQPSRRRPSRAKK